MEADSIPISVNPLFNVLETVRYFSPEARKSILDLLITSILMNFG